MADVTPSNLLVIRYRNDGRALLKALGLRVDNWHIVEPFEVLAGARFSKIVVITPYEMVRESETFAASWQRWIEEKVTCRLLPGNMNMTVI